MPDITVVGSFVVDLMARTPHMPVPGETVIGGPFKLGPGGKGANQAVAAARLGRQVALVTKLGEDDFTQLALDSFDREGLDARFVYRDPQSQTSTALIIVDDKTGQNMIVVTLGANETLTPEEVEAARQTIAESKVLVCGFEVAIPATAHACKIGHELKVPVILNTAPPVPIENVPKDLWQHVTIATPNESELARLVGEEPTNDLDRIGAYAQKLQALGVGTIVVTLGKNGALIVEKDKLPHRVEPYLVDAVDTTGAGDAFNGGLATAIAEGKSLEDAVRFANAVGAISTLKVGTSVANPTRTELEAFLANYY